MAVERIEPAYDGLDTDGAPDAIAKTRAPVLENFLVDRPGLLPIRGPINDPIAIYSGGVVAKPLGVWAHNDNLLVSFKSNSPTAVRDPWVGPYRRVAAAAEYGNPVATIYHVDLVSGTVTPISISGNPQFAPGICSTRLGDYTWGIGYQAATSFSANGGIHKLYSLLRWDGTAVAPTVVANGPTSAQSVRAHLNRLFVGGACAPFTLTYSPNSIFWSDHRGPLSGTLAEWQDDASGLTNEIVVDSNDPSDCIVALAKVRGALCVLKRHSVHMLLGDTPSSFVVRPVSTDVGCIDPRSVVEYSDGVFFMSERGFMHFDGVTLTNTTDNLRSSITSAAVNAVGDRGVDGGRVVAGLLPNDYILVSVGVTPNTAAGSDMTICGLYHPPRRAWASLTSDAMSCQRPVALARTLTRTVVLDEQTAFQADALTAPEIAAEAERGFDVGRAGDEAIPARWYSKLARLSQSFHASAVQRLAVDYTFTVDGAADDASGGWTVSLVDGRGNVLVTPTQVPAQGDPSSHAYRRQFLTDVYGEADDAQLRVEWSGPATALKDASIFQSHIEYEAAQRRGSR